MNHLPVAGEDEWKLPTHAHIVIYDDEDKGMLTIYDCGATQEPPLARVIGHLVNVDADHRRINRPNGFVVRLHEHARLEEQGKDHWVIRAS